MCIVFVFFIEESLTEFHQTLQTHLYLQDKGKGPILSELFPFVILNALCIDIALMGQSTCTTAFNGTIQYFAYTM